MRGVGARQKAAAMLKARAADVRVKLTHEAVQGAKTLKFHGWEGPFGEARPS